MTPSIMDRLELRKNLRAQRAALSFDSVERVGDDLRIVARIVAREHG